MELQRFENADEDKFWEVWIDKTTVFMRFGKTGSSGQTKLKKCADASTASKEEKRFITEKEKQGFTLISSAPPPKKTAKNPDLEKAIIANPASPDAYAVYGDWLNEQGDPLGELVAVQIANEKKGGKDKALQKKSSDLIKKNEASWLGDVAKAEHKELTWKFGFLHKARFGDEEFCEDDPAVLYEALRKAPVSRFLNHLEFWSFEDDDGQPSYQPVLKAMASNGIPPTLRSLVFDVRGYQISWTSLGDLSKLYGQLANLEVLRLAVGSMKFGAMNLPNLKSLTIETGGLGKDNIKSIIGAKWPKLETLVLYMGVDEYGCNFKVKELEPILDGKPFPKVTKLALCNSEWEDDIAKAIPKAKIVKQLKSLDLSKGEMSDAGAQALLDGVKSLSHLELLDVTQNYISTAMQKKLKAAFGAKINCGNQGDSAEEYKYCQVAE